MGVPRFSHFLCFPLNLTRYIYIYSVNVRLINCYVQVSLKYVYLALGAGVAAFSRKLIIALTTCLIDK